MSPTATRFSLSEFVRGVHYDTAEIDPDKLTKAVITALAGATKDEQAIALEQAIRSFVQHSLNNVRHSPKIFPGGQGSDGAQSGGAAGEPKANSARSWKTRGASDYWRVQLEIPYWDGAETWVAFGDLTSDALDRMTAYHSKLAVANQLKATEMHDWSELLREHKVTTIKDLPEAVLRARLDKGHAA
jgi:hypothetical protein